MVKGRKILTALIGLAVVMTMTGTGWAVGNVKQEMWPATATTTLDDAILVVRGAAATTVTTRPSLEYPGNMMVPDPLLDTYVERLTAWVVAPVTGNYTFYIAGDDDCGLWIGETPIVDVATTPPLCRVTGWAGYRDFTGNAERQSAPVALVAGTAYKLVAIHREGTGGDFVSVGWTLPGGTTIAVIGSAFITDESKAGGAVPADTQTDVKSGVLSWLPPAKSSGSGLTYDVYFGTDANLPAPYLKTSNLAATTYDAGAVNGSDLLFSKAYYWRIDTRDPNIGGTPVLRVGNVWSLTTNNGKPYIVTPPANVFGALNGSASFTVAAATLAPTPLFYQWQFKSFFGTTWTNLNGATGPTYSKTGLQPSDRGLYRVTITDLYSNSVTSEARLYMRIGLVNRYSFTDNANDSVSGAHGTIYQTTGYPATFIDAPGTTGDPTKRQLYLTNGPTRTGSVANLLAYVDLPNGVVSTLGTQATFMVWFTWRDTDTGQSWQRVFDFGNSVGGENVPGTGNNYLMLTPRSDGRTPRFGYKIRDGGEERYLNASASLATSTGEVCYAITWNESTSRAEMYRNGKLVAAGDTHFTLSSVNDVNNWLGRAQWNDNGFWGNLNEFRIYDTALPGNAIAQSYALGADVLPANPCVSQPTADLNQDCVINLADFAVLAAQWMSCGLTTCP